MTKSEEWAYSLCRKSFFSLFSFVNPVGKKDKELCDVIVICGNDIVLISVKEININLTGNYEVDYNRWNNRAIEDSLKQLNGAERFLKRVSSFRLKDTKEEIELPDEKNFYKIALAIGAKGKFPISESIRNNGYVNIMDEISFHSIISELDTITDFILYLREKQAKLLNVHFTGNGEEDLLAFYLRNELNFPDKSFLYFDKGIYESLIVSEDYQQEKKNREESYKWDFIINHFTQNYFDKNGYNSITLNNMRKACEIMAKETRFERIKLIDNLNTVINSNVRARIYFSPTFNHIIYVFVSGKFENEKQRLKETELRSLVAAFLFNKSATVIAIAWEVNPNFDVYDIVYHNYKDLWSNNLDKVALSTINELGYFKSHYDQLNR
ncbi:hypothetical protein BAY06_00995 [Elizabethkingia anophelis]|uniref:hypothetical protein n=1 Tax=Elizabethkingia anophelis TaxID=1117645 RepID=UPI00099B0AC9|nr:hypothetical protein [Elizabethkingia anophelis]OPC55491.1 hypothetical protein BAY06_00995 [Elizabethkingia anophelis]